MHRLRRAGNSHPPSATQSSPHPSLRAYVADVRNFLLFLLTLGLAGALGACASKPKSSARIYDGDAPTIRYAPSEAGGPQSVY